MSLRFCFACLALIGASPATAGWQYTNWGITPQQVVTASKGKAQLGNGEAGDVLGNSMRVKAVGTHASGRWQFRTVFYFENDKLSRISAKLLNGEGGCGSLWADMNSTYGTPFSDKRKDTTRAAIWQDASKNNRVSLLEIGSHCYLGYQPLKGQDSSGL